MDQGLHLSDARYKKLLLLVEQALAGTPNLSGTTGGPDVALGDLATPSSAILFAMDLTPKRSGIFSLSFALRASMSADDELEMSIQSAPALTSLTGGAAAGNGTMRYETLGSPIVVASGTPVEQSQYDEDTTGATGELQIVWAGTVAVPLGRSVILVTLTAPVATLTGIKLNALALEVG